MNGDLRVAYRASPPGARDIVFVGNWLTCCDLFPELPPNQGQVEAMTSVGSIFFDQPGTGASDPDRAGALPTLEQRPWGRRAAAKTRSSVRSGRMRVKRVSRRRPS